VREYAKFQPRYWTSGPGKKYRGDPDAQLVGAYLFTAPTSNMLGIFYLPKSTIAHDLGLSQEGASKALLTLSEGAFCSYDDETEMIWVHEMARIQVLDKEKPLKPKDKRVKGIKRELLKHQDCVHFQAFIERYKNDLLLENLDIKKQNQAPLKPLPNSKKRGQKPHRSKEQEQEKEKDHDRARDDEWFSTDTVAAIFSELRKAAGGGKFKHNPKNYTALEGAVDWAKDEAIGAEETPSEITRTSIAFFIGDEKARANGWPFTWWANDPGSWVGSIAAPKKEFKQPDTPEEAWAANQGGANEK